MRTAAGILMIIAGILLCSIMKAALGHVGLLGWLLTSGLIFGGIEILRRKQGRVK